MSSLPLPLESPWRAGALALAERAIAWCEAAAWVLDGAGEVLAANRTAALLDPHGAGPWPLLGPSGRERALQRMLGDPAEAFLARGPQGAGLPREAPDAAVEPGWPLEPLGEGLWVLRRLTPGQAHPQAHPQAQAAGFPAVSSPPPVHEHDHDVQAYGPLRQLFWRSPFPLWLQDAHGRIVETNVAFQRWTGHSPEALRGRTSASLHRGEEPWPAEPAPSACSSSRDAALLGHDGQLLWYRASRMPVQAVAAPELWLTLFQDVSRERQHAQWALSTEKELQRWFEFSPVGMLVFDRHGRVLRCNAAATSLLGGDWPHLADAPAPVRALLGLQGGGDGADGPAPADGSAVLRQAWIQSPQDRAVTALIRQVLDEDGQAQVMAVLEDRSAEAELAHARQDLGALTDTVQVGLLPDEDEDPPAAEAEASGRAASGAARVAVKREAHRARLRLPGLAQVDLRQVPLEQVSQATRPQFERLLGALSRQEPCEARYALLHPRWGRRFYWTRLEPRVNWTGRRSLSVVTIDVTPEELERERHAALLKELHTVLEASSAGMAYLQGHVFSRCNSAMELMLGCRPGTLVGQTFSLGFGSEPELLTQAEQAWAQLDHQPVVEVELCMERQGLFPRWCHLTLKRLGEPGSDVVAVLTDVSRLKSQSLEMEQLARDRESMFNLSDVGMVFIQGGRIQRANEAFLRMCGRAAPELSHLALRDLLPPGELYDRWHHHQQESLRLESVWTGEGELRRADGTVVWVQVSARQVQPGRPELGVIASYVDVDDRRKAEEALANVAQHTRAILDSVFVGIVTVGPQGIQWMNRSARRMFAGELADFFHAPMSVVATDDMEHPFRQTQALKQLHEGQVHSFECQVRARDGRLFWVVGNAVASATGVGPREYTFALLDIDRRRQAEERARQAQASVQRIIESAPMAIAVCEADDLAIATINQAGAAAAGQEAMQLLGVPLPEVFPEWGVLGMEKDARAALRQRSLSMHEYRFIRHGQQLTWELRFMPLEQGPKGQPQLLVLATDVTDQRAAQAAQLEAAIAQRDLLVREVHHRIKNNLQGVAGLMQQVAIRRPEMAAPISEVVSQVQAIAQVYGLQVGTHGPLPIAGVLQAICQSVGRTFGCDIVGEGLDAPDKAWCLPEAESIPIALTVNELLTNAVKHARGPGVRCRLETDEQGVRILIRSQSRLPEQFDLLRFSGVSGLGLVRALLPRKSAKLQLQQQGEWVEAAVSLQPGCIVPDPGGPAERAAPTVPRPGTGDLLAGAQ